MDFLGAPEASAPEPLFREIELREYYFANLCGDGKASGALGDLPTSTYGSLARWEELFRSSSMSLGGGSG